MPLEFTEEDALEALKATSWGDAVYSSLMGCLFTAILLLLLIRLFKTSLTPFTAAPHPYLPKLGLLTLLTFFVVSTVTPLLIVSLLQESPEEMAPASRTQLAIYVTVLCNLIVIGLALILARRSGVPLIELGFRRPALRAVLFGILAFLCVIPAFLGVQILNSKVGTSLGLEENQHLVQSLMDDTVLRENPLVIACIILVIPAMEEIVFRGILQRSLQGVFMPAVSIVFSSLIFAAVHDIQSSIPVFTLGVALGLMYHLTGSIWVPAIAHSIFNTCNVWFITTQTVPKEL